MGAINLGVLNFGSRIDLTGLNKGVASVRSVISSLVSKAPGIGGAFQAASVVASRAMLGLRNVMGVVGGAVRSLIGAFGPLLALLGPLALIAFLKNSVDQFKVQENAISKLDSALAVSIQSNSKLALSSSELASKTAEASKEMQAFASELQSVTTHGDEVIIGVQAILASLGKLEGEGLKRATRAVLDLSDGMGIDLEGAGQLVAKTLASSTNAMSRYGIEVEGAVGSTERLDSVIEGIASKFGGLAENQAKTMAGRITQLGNAFSDIQEEVGGFVLKLFDLGGTSDGVIDKLESMRDAILNATQTSEFRQLVTIVKEAASAIFDMFNEIVDTTLAMLGMSKQANETNRILILMKKAAQTFVFSLRLMTLGITILKISMLTLKAAMQSAWAIIVGIVAKASLDILRPLQAVGDGAAAWAELFGAKLPGSVQAFRNSIMGAQATINNFARGTVALATSNTNDLEAALNDAARPFAKLVDSTLELIGVNQTAETIVRDFADEIDKTGRTARTASESQEELGSATEKAGKAAKEAKDKFEILNKIIQAGQKAADAFRSGIESVRGKLNDLSGSLRDQIDALGLRNATLRASEGVDKINADAAEKALDISNRRRDSIAEVTDELAKLAEKEKELQAAVAQGGVTVALPVARGAVGPTGPQEPIEAASPELADQAVKLAEQHAETVAALTILQAERARLATEGAANVLQIEARSSAEIINLNIETEQAIGVVNKAAEDDRRAAADVAAAEALRLSQQSVSDQIKTIQDTEKVALQQLDITKRQRILDGEDKLNVEKSIGIQRLDIVRDTESQIQALNAATGKMLADVGALEVEATFQVEQQKLAIREAARDRMVKENDDRLVALKSVIDTELLIVKDGQIQFGDILAGTQQKILASIVKTVNDSFAAWLAGQTQMVAASQDANSKIQGKFGDTGNILTKIFGGLFGGGKAGGGGGGFLSGLLGVLAPGLLGFGVSLLTPVISKFTGKLLGPINKFLGGGDDAPKSTGTSFEGISAGGSGIFSENARAATSTAQSVARDTGATNLIQQISFPVTIKVETQESDRIAESISKVMKDEVAPMLKDQIATKEREAILRSLGTPRRLSFA